MRIKFNLFENFVKLFLFVIVLFVLIVAGLSYFLRINLTAKGKGIVNSQKTFDVRSEVEGIVKKVFIEENQYITAGSVLLHLENRKKKIEIKEAKVKMLEIETEIQKLNYKLLSKTNSQSLKLKEEEKELMLFNSQYSAKKSELLTRIKRLNNEVELKTIETQKHLGKVKSYLNVIQLFQSKIAETSLSHSLLERQYTENIKRRFHKLVGKLKSVGNELQSKKEEIRPSNQTNIPTHPTTIEQKIRESLLKIEKTKVEYERVKNLQAQDAATKVELYDAEFEVKNKQQYCDQLKSEVYEQIWNDLTESSVNLKEIDILINELDNLQNYVRKKNIVILDSKKNKQGSKIVNKKTYEKLDGTFEFDHIELQVIRTKIEQTKLSKKRVLYQQKELITIEKEIHNLEKRLQAEKRSYDILKKELMLTVIKSPIDGYVLKNNPIRLLGKMVNPGQSLLRIGDTSSYIVEAKIQESEFPLVKKNQNAKIRIVPFPKGEYRYYNATVASVGANTLENGEKPKQKSTGEFPVVLFIQPPYGVTIFDKYYDLKPGYSADVEIITNNERLLNLFARRVLRIKGELRNSNIGFSSYETEDQNEQKANKSRYFLSKKFKIKDGSNNKRFKIKDGPNQEGKTSLNNKKKE